MDGVVLNLSVRQTIKQMGAVQYSLLWNLNDRHGVLTSTNCHNYVMNLLKLAHTYFPLAISKEQIIFWDSLPP